MIRLSREEIALLDKKEKRIYAEYLERQASLTDLFTYMQKVSGVKEYPHTKLLCQWIDALLEGRLYRTGPGPLPVDGANPFTGDPVLYNLAIYMGPRHGKSFTVSDHLPAYVLTKYGQIKVTFATMSDDFAQKWSAKVRDRIVETSEFFGVDVIGGYRAAREYWQTTLKGEYKAAGKGGQILGTGWQLGIADDLIGGYDEAKSPTERDNAQEWWNYTWWRRRERWTDGTPPRGLLMNTRWTVDDIAGRVVDEKWAVLNIPAISLGDDDPLHRPEGAVLCEEIMPLAELLEEQAKDPKMFASQYQGSPYLDGGNIIHDPFNLLKIEEKDYKLILRDGTRISIPEKDCSRFGVVDLAASVKKTADWTVVGTFDVTPTTPRRLILRHIHRMKLQTQDHEGEIIKIYKEMGHKFLAIEDITFGTSLINNLRVRGDVTLRPVKPVKDKVMRALPLDGLIRDELLWWPEDAAWRMLMEEEVLSFPDGKHDDMVDVMAYAAEIFRTIPKVRSKPKGYENISEMEAYHLAERKRKKPSRATIHPELGRL